MENKYTRVSCEFYDLLESIATRKEKIEITYQTKKGNSATNTSMIKTLETKDKAEFLILANDKKIRLDKIESIKIKTDGNPQTPN